jgi:putative ABC transport system permease protein
MFVEGFPSATCKENLNMNSILSLLNSMPGAVSQGLIWGIVAIGVYITYRILEISDLSVDGSIATGGAVCVMLIHTGFNPWLALLCSFTSGMLAGLVTGLFHTRCGIPAILSGILTQLALYSINLRILGSKSNQAVSVDKYDLIVSQRYIHNLNLENPLPVLILILLAIICILYWFFGTERGCSIRATGANRYMAKAQGINTNSNIVLGLMLSNGLVALAGALLSQYQGSVDVNMGRGAIVIGLAAVTMGEVIFGKVFKNYALKLSGVVLGSIIYYIVLQIVLQLGLNTNDLKLFTAVAVAVFLAVPYWKAKLPNKAQGGNRNA